VKFHINPETGKADQCRAKIQCRFSINGIEPPHFASLEEAQNAYEKTMDRGTVKSLQKLKKKKLYAPAKSSTKILTLNEAEEQLERVRKYMKDVRKVQKVNPALEGNVLSYGLAGSIVYNLDHPESDRDIVIITDSNQGQDFQHVFKAQTPGEDDDDIRVSSAFHSVEKITKGTPNEVDAHYSGTFNTIKENPLSNFLNAARFDKLAYIDRLGRNARSDMRKAFKSEEMNSRSSKALKTALRNFVIHERLLREESLRPRFTEDERELFYRENHELLNWVDDVKRIKHKYTEEEFDEICIEKILESARRVK